MRRMSSSSHIAVIVGVVLLTASAACARPARVEAGGDVGVATSATEPSTALGESGTSLRPATKEVNVSAQTKSVMKRAKP